MSNGWLAAGQLTSREFTELYDTLHVAWNEAQYGSSIETEFEDLLNDLDDLLNEVTQ